MKLRLLWAFMAVYLLLGSLFVFILLKPNFANEPDASAYNDIVQSLGKQWRSLESESLPGSEYHLEYAVLDLDGNLLAATKDGLDVTIPAAIRHRDVMLDIVSDGAVVGKVIVMNSAPRYIEQVRQSLMLAGAVLLLVPLLFCAGFAFYLNRNILRPFKQLEGFAQRVASGNLELPLLMDKHNIFGPFTESFDLMRSELARARHAEYLADLSKKELVASLSHDIKTPLASIQAITELLIVRETDTYAKKYLETIEDKTKQITALVTNLFNASLEDLQKLKVAPQEESSSTLKELLGAADYAGRAGIPEAPPCLLNIDRLRLSQVFDNIFSNSYKYAETEIEVQYSVSDAFLTVTVSDFGPGVPEGDLPLLCRKFYRGENAEGKSGSGLGLYLTRFFVEQMGGSVLCENRREGGMTRGFAVTVNLPLSGRKASHDS